MNVSPAAQPVAWGVALIALVNSVLAFLVLQDVLDPNAAAALTLIASNVVALGTALVVRQAVTPVGSG